MFRLQNNQGRTHEWNLHSEGEKAFSLMNLYKLAKKIYLDFFYNSNNFFLDSWSLRNYFKIRKCCVLKCKSSCRQERH